ncbi:uncharacterized protein C4orf36 homolog [Hemicordylus capensis]|uniref:uncharacterized protein C4orf36 homolog n=1 Tax=Hemicordylus capensis TaxID=884348 RepID=UPI002303A913|nr:uncharacterized protein C4orf36 homolog [Hemicordylus capensis]XP_053110838.1 uncharacterized protein C4orf36 homolog [Hemicordylus capensis]
MEYNLHRKRNLTAVLKASIYEVHDRAEFALLTKRLLAATEEVISNPLHHDICWGSPFKLRPVTTIVKVRVPSLQTIESERLLERQRFEKIELQHKVAQQTESEFKRRRFLARRPLPPFAFN